MKLKKYSKYKQSWIDWIWEIPGGWEVRKLKYILWTIQSWNRETWGGSIHDNWIISLWGEHINWDWTIMYNTNKLISEDYYNKLNQWKVKEWDTLLVKDWATIWKTAFLDKKPFEKIAVNEHVFLMRPNSLFNSKLLYYQISSDLWFQQIKLTETGSAQWWINLWFPDKVLFPVSLSLQTQQRISSFLDSKTLQIENLIEKDKKLIELLKERRVSLINQAVTKWIEKNVKMKNSWVEWIWKIPEGWEVRKLKFSLSIRSWEWLSNEEFNENWEYSVIWWNWEMTKADKYNLNWKHLIVWRVWAYCWNIHKVEWKNWITDNALIIDRIKNYNIDFLKELLISRWLNSLSVSNAQPLITWTMVKEENLPLPIIQEQQKIVDFLDKETTKIDNHIKKVEKRIELYEEYKKSLIYNVVTGKVEV